MIAKKRRERRDPRKPTEASAPLISAEKFAYARCREGARGGRAQRTGARCQLGADAVRSVRRRPSSSAAALLLAICVRTDLPSV